MTKPVAEPSLSTVLPPVYAPVTAPVAKKCTVLGALAKVKGNVSVGEDLVLRGIVEGDIRCAGAFTLEGTVTGNVTCSSFALSGTLQGDLACAGKAQIAPGGRMTGNVRAADFALGGSLTGDAVVSGLASLSTAEARMNGNLTTARVRVEEGAQLTGKVEMTDLSKGRLTPNGADGHLPTPADRK